MISEHGTSRLKNNGNARLWLGKIKPQRLTGNEKTSEKSEGSPVVGEERRVPPALILVEHVHLSLERFVHRHALRDVQNLSSGLNNRRRQRCTSKQYIILLLLVLL